jgi:UDP-glucose 4-epimerase
MNQQKTLLITGASGFLGTWLAKEAFKAGYTIFGIDLRAPLQPQIWTDFAVASLETVDLEQLLNGHSLDAVCHLAGSASVTASVKNPFGDFASLLPGTSRLALYIARAQPQARMFFFSSAAVYGDPKILPITETTPVFPISPYGVHKATAEMLLLQYARLYNLQLTIFRIFSVYGPELRKQLIWDVSQRALTADTKSENSITLFGTGAESRDFIYVKDLCRAVLLAISQTAEENIEIYNLASGVESSIADVAKCLVKHLGVQVQIEFDGVVPTGDPTNWSVDISKLSGLSFCPQYSLEQGIQQVASWAKAIH